MESFDFFPLYNLKNSPWPEVFLISFQPLFYTAFFAMLFVFNSLRDNYEIGCEIEYLSDVVYFSPILSF